MILTLGLFLLGVVVCAVVARYNESNNLFWKLFVAFTTSYAIGTMVLKHITSNQSKAETTQVYPTQEIVVTPSTFMYLLGGDSTTITVEETPTPVSQVFAPVSECITLSKVAGGIRDQPIHIFPNPPNTS